MIRQFLSPVPVRALNSSFGSFLALLDERGYYRLGVLARHLGQHQITRMTLDQGRDVAVVRPGQEIAFPMARHRPIAISLIWPRLLPFGSTGLERRIERFDRK